MDKRNIDKNWTFIRGSSDRVFDDSREKVKVDLPHDYSISIRDPHSKAGGSFGYFAAGTAAYEKLLSIPEEWAGKKLYLEFEGVYMNATVYVNDNIVARHPNGYTSFHCDISQELLYGQENKIHVLVNNDAVPNTRWYSGSGIYRHVWLHVGENIHIAPWGVFATTPEVSPENAAFSIRTMVANKGPAAGIIVRSTLLNASGHEVEKVENGQEISEGTSHEVIQELKVSAPRLWSVETPYLYQLKSEIIHRGRVVDSTTTNVGIRSLSFDAKNGFRLNGVSMKLNGGCIHSENGILGSASFDRAEERKVELLKSNGFNAVRCAHNPPSPAFLDACDRLGLLVINEAFDVWREAKSPHDYSLIFEDWWERDLSSMIVRDRNHPSVIMWSTGNEVPELTGNSDGFSWSRKLADYARSLDDTRAITNALQDFYLGPTAEILPAFDLMVPEDKWIEHSSKFAEALDVVGYNYGRYHYENDGNNFPDRVICGQESFALKAFENWEDVERYPYLIGDFVWTALDYMGETGLGKVSYDKQEGKQGLMAMLDSSYPWHLAYCGDLDICGFKRPQSFYRDCVWGIARAPYIVIYKPENHGKTPNLSCWSWYDVESSWTWPGYEGKPTVADVYCRDSEVELILNGKSLGRKAAGKANRYIASFELVYEPGELIAVGYENGVQTSRTRLKTAGLPASIRLIPDRSTLKAESDDLSYIKVELIDARGNRVDNAADEIYFTVYGEGTLLAVGNGNPVSDQPYVGNQRKAYEGRAMAVVRSTGKPGEVVLMAAADGIPATSVTISVR